MHRYFVIQLMSRPTGLCETSCNTRNASALKVHKPLSRYTFSSRQCCCLSDTISFVVIFVVNVSYLFCSEYKMKVKYTVFRLTLKKSQPFEQLSGYMHFQKERVQCFQINSTGVIDLLAFQWEFLEEKGSYPHRCTWSTLNVFCGHQVTHLFLILGVCYFDYFMFFVQSICRECVLFHFPSKIYF